MNSDPESRSGPVNKCLGVLFAAQSIFHEPKTPTSIKWGKNPIIQEIMENHIKNMASRPPGRMGPPGPHTGGMSGGPCGPEYSVFYDK